MSRAGALWNALSDSQRASVYLELAHLPFGHDLAAALDADARDRGSMPSAGRYPHDGALLPVSAAGPRRPAERCEGCGDAVTTGLVPIWDYGLRRQVGLGPGCWRERMLARARGREVSGEQLQAFPASFPIKEEQ